MNDNNETAVIACEIKISLDGCSYEEVQQLIKRIREGMDESYRLDIKFSGEFFRKTSKPTRMCTVAGAPGGGWQLIAMDPPIES